MSELIPRRPVSAAAGLTEIVGELRAPAARQQVVRAQLADMQRRGEIASAFNARIDVATGEYVVNYVRLKDPPRRYRKAAAIALAAISAPITIGGLIWHSRHVWLLAGKLALVLLAAVALLVLVRAVVSALAGEHGHCPGAWHR